MRISDFDFPLPKNLIARHPPAHREDSRMMVIDRASGKIEHSVFTEFSGYFGPKNTLVLNDTRVIPARVWGRASGKDVEFLFIREKSAGEWETLCRPAKRVKTGERIDFAPDFSGRVTEEGSEGLRTLRFDSADVLARLRQIGFAPLPPYIKRDKEQADLRSQDLERYQTVYAGKEGAIAAPTAGLHFTDSLLADLGRRGVAMERIRLDVGVATFQPVRVDLIEDHKMLEERFEISETAARRINDAKRDGRTVTAVGTTVVRTLESAGREGTLRAGCGATALFIRPGFEFRIVDQLLTNFHLPQSTLLMLVSAFTGYDLVMRAYREAVRERYRFFSYGDCMLIL